MQTKTIFDFENYFNTGKIELYVPERKTQHGYTNHTLDISYPVPQAYLEPGSGLHICCVHPGGVTTNIARAARSNRSDAEREAMADRFETMTGTTPASAAAQILAAMERRKPRLLIGGDAKFITLVSRLFPTAYAKILGFFGGKALREMATGETAS